MRDENLIKNYFNKRAKIASGLNRSDRISFFSENPEELCDRLCLIIQEKQTESDTNIIDDEIVAIFDKLFDYKRITPTQHKKHYK